MLEAIRTTLMVIGGSTVILGVAAAVVKIMMLFQWKKDIEHRMDVANERMGRHNEYMQELCRRIKSLEEENVRQNRASDDEVPQM